MEHAISETERKVIDILTQHPVTTDANVAPIYAVDRAMGWGTVETRHFVDGLVRRGLIHYVPVVRDGPKYDPKSYWKEGARGSGR